jgi:hypothetical protein
VNDESAFSILTVTTNEQPLTKESTLSIKYPSVSDAGSYECRLVVGSQSESARFILNVDDGKYYQVFHDATYTNTKFTSKTH